MATTQIAAQMLGKLPVRTDVRTLSLARYVDSARLPAPPDVFDETSGVGGWPMYANDRIGDCTTAAAAHMIEAWSAAGRGQAIELPESAVLDAFDHVKLADPLTGEEGAVELDVLRYWRATGIGGHRIELPLDLRRHRRVRPTRHSACLHPAAPRRVEHLSPRRTGSCGHRPASPRQPCTVPKPRGRAHDLRVRPRAARR